MTSDAGRSGRYPIERREGEIERLRIQAAAMAPDADLMLARIGVAPGWRCLDLGCGPGGILELLSRRTGATGQVIGLDADAILLAAARAWTQQQGLPNVELIQGDAYRTGLPAASFDLVHVRFLASTAGRGEALLSEAISLARPGGVVAFEEPDTDTLVCHPPHPAWDHLRRILQEAFERVGGDTRLARRLFGMLRRAGLEEVRYRPFLVGVVSGQPMTDFLPSTIESMRQVLLEQRLVDAAELDAALAACRRHLADPETTFTTYLVAQVWGRKPTGQPG